VNKAIETLTIFYVFLWIKPSIIAMATSLEGSKKTNFRLIIYSYGSTNPEHLVNIGLVDFEIPSLTGSVNKINK